MAGRAVLFDVGGPLDTERVQARLLDQTLRRELASAGYPVTPAAYRAAVRWAINSFASNADQAVVWRLTRHNVEVAQRIYAAAGRHVRARDLFELRPGIPELLHDLCAQGLRLGIVANQPTRIIAKLEQAGIARYFAYLGISAVTGLQKPDPRLFVAAAEALGVQPRECIMVGDRIDNDIAPARLLGMRTVLLRLGRHQQQQPRTWLEVPDAEVSDVPGLRRAIADLVSGA